MRVKDLTQPKSMSGDQAHNLVKDLLSQSLSKSGKVKALKVKIKFGDGEKSKPKKTQTNWASNIMSSLANATVIQDLIVAGMFIVGIVAAYRISKSSKLPADTIKNLQESNASLVGLNATREAEIKKLSDEVHANNTAHTEEVLRLNKEISELVGQIKVYKELPLQELAQGIKQVAALTKLNADSNQRILETLLKSANDLSSEKHDGGVLVKSQNGTPLEVNVK